MSDSTRSSDTEYQKAIITIGVLAGAFIIAVIIAKIVDYCYDRHIAISDDASDISEHTRNLIRARLVVNKIGQLRKAKDKDKNKNGDENKTEEETSSRKMIRLWSVRAKESRRIAEQRRAEDAARQRKEVVITVEEAVSEAKLQPSPTVRFASLLVVKDASPGPSPRQQTTADLSPRHKPAPFKRMLTGLNGSLRTADATGFAKVTSSGNKAVFPERAFVQPLTFDSDSPAEDGTPPSLDKQERDLQVTSQGSTQDFQTTNDLPETGQDLQTTAQSNHIGVHNPQTPSDDPQSTAHNPHTSRQEAQITANVGHASRSSGLDTPKGQHCPTVGTEDTSCTVRSENTAPVEKTGSGKQASVSATHGAFPPCEQSSEARSSKGGVLGANQAFVAKPGVPSASVAETDGVVTTGDPPSQSVVENSGDALTGPSSSSGGRPLSSRKVFTVVTPGQFNPATRPGSTTKGATPRARSPTKAPAPSPRPTGSTSNSRPKSLRSSDQASPSHRPQLSRSVAVHQGAGQLNVHKNPGSTRTATPSNTNSRALDNNTSTRTGISPKKSRVKSAVL